MIIKHKQPSLILLDEIKAAGYRISVEACSSTNTAVELGLTALKHANIAVSVRYPRNTTRLWEKQLEHRMQHSFKKRSKEKHSVLKGQPQPQEPQG
ncbi:hypothetical protein A2U01_0000754 [Trifolium medium]|uniref:Uncharacterized protein n=1 Tax=Trifolium medium TaxID=97028 RepID=A0A392LYE0_9FABA|nr:hypothetical protein [Trifolium medium]